LAAGWFHQTLDLIAFGRIYACLHRKKDAESQRIPGLRHRQVGHELYQSYGKLWDHVDRLPQWLIKSIQTLKESQGADAAEEKTASCGHDILDRTWDDLRKEEREYWEGCFIWLLYHPEILESWAGVDVIRGRIQRTVDGQKIWEDSPETRNEYKILRREVSRHQKRRLREVLARWG